MLAAVVAVVVVVVVIGGSNFSNDNGLCRNFFAVALFFFPAKLASCQILKRKKFVGRLNVYAYRFTRGILELEEKSEEREREKTKWEKPGRNQVGEKDTGEKQW